VHVRLRSLHVILLAALSAPFALSSLQAQIEGDIEAEVPFSFVVADKTLGRGHYLMRLRGGDDPAMEIHGPRGRGAVRVPVTISVGPNVPPKSGLVFNQYENQTFLAKILVQGCNEAAEIEPSGGEKNLRRHGQRPKVLFHPAKHRRTAPDTDPN
jgi:hypothetical protein